MATADSGSSTGEQVLLFDSHLLCPECGTSSRDRPTALATRTIWTLRALSWLALIASVAVLVGGLRKNLESFGTTSPSPSWWQPWAGRLTPSDLKAVVAGERDGSDFIDAMRKSIAEPFVGDGAVLVRFSPPAGTRRDTTVFGWPTPCLTTSHEGQYEDLFARRDPVPQDWGIRTHSLWSHTTSWTAGATPSATNTTYSIWPGQLALTILYVIGGWHIGCGVRWLLGKGAPCSTQMRRALPIACGSLVLAAYTAGAVLFPDHRVSYHLEPTTPSWFRPSLKADRPSFDTGWTVRDLKAALGAPSASKGIADRLLKLVPAGTADDLIVEFGSESKRSTKYSHVRAGWPLPWISWGTEKDLNDAPAGLGGLPHLVFNSWGSIGWQSTEGTTLRYVTVELSEVALYVLAAWLAWHLLRATAFVIEWRLILRRRTRGLCIKCGYDLSGLRAQAP